MASVRQHVAPFVAAVAEAGSAAQMTQSSPFSAEAAIPSFSPRSVGRIALHDFAAEDACEPQERNTAVQALLELRAHLLDARCACLCFQGASSRHAGI